MDKNKFKEMIFMLHVFYSPPKKYSFSFEEWDKSMLKVEPELKEKNAKTRENIKKDKNKRLYKIRKHVRPHILERDNFKCVKCGSTENITIHHKVEISQGGSDSEDNLITLCYKCHAFEHRNESIYKAMKVKIQE